MKLFTRAAILASAFFWGGVGWGQNGALSKPIPWQQMGEKLHPSRQRPDLVARHSAAEQGRMQAAVQAGTLQTLPYWQGSFSIDGKEYDYTILGGDPSVGGTTIIPTVIVPIRLTISDFSEDGKSAVVVDATPIVGDILRSPIFAKSDYISGNKQQFTDAMLRTEFPQAAAEWHTILSPTVYPTVDITVPTGDSKVYQSKSGKLLAVVTHDAVIDQPIFKMIGDGTFPPTENIIFVTYNALEHDAFGYHAAVFRDQKTEEMVFSYTSWLEDVDDLLSVPSPDAATLSHEIAETVHDAFAGNLSSRTLLWGDPFFQNQCFQTYIEVWGRSGGRAWHDSVA